MDTFHEDTPNLSGSHSPSNTTSESTSVSDFSITPIPSSQLCEGLDGKIQRYHGIHQLESAVNAQSEKLSNDETTDQYLIFWPVTESECEKIGNWRYQIGRRDMRLTHYTDIRTLIIKLTTATHEVVARSFGDELLTQFLGMWIPREERIRLGATTCKGIWSSKEGDEAFKPGTFRPYAHDWPTIVFEAGVSSESLPMLRNDARWWLSNSRDAVKIVLVFHINPRTETMQIEKWEIITPTTPAHATGSSIKSASNSVSNTRNHHRPRQHYWSTPNFTLRQNLSPPA